MPEQAPIADGPDNPGDLGAMLRRCAAGDQLAWSRLVRDHAGLVYSIARDAGLPEHQCDDLAQHVFSTLLRNLDSIRSAPALPAWLAQTTRRAAWRARADARKRDAMHTDAERLEIAADPDETPLLRTARLEEAHRVRRALDVLGGRCRDLLRAVFVESDAPDYDTIASRLSIPRGSIGPTRARCLAKLAELLGNPP
jgi:RNA polymerase sigma factor (sigma-70 family)